MYGAVAVRWGPAAALLTTGVLFGLVHWPLYGWAVVPLDVAAGLVLSWQRWVSGSWVVPALAHSAANVLAIW